MTSIKYIRKIIGVETQLGFMFVPAKAQEHLPNQNVKLRVCCSGATRAEYSLSYNATYNRIFGLSQWYRDNNINEGTFLDVKIDESVVYISTQNKFAAQAPLTIQQRNINVLNISSVAKGNIVEDRIKEVILLLGQGVLNVYKPVVDNEGIDLIALKNGQFHSIFLQVKSRYNVRQSNKMTLTLGKNFKAHHSYFVVGVSFDANDMEMDDKILFVPSKDVKEKAIELSDGNLRIVASYNDRTNDQWKNYWVTKDQLVQKLFEKFTALEEVWQ